MIQYLITALIDFAIAGLALRKSKSDGSLVLFFTATSIGLWSTELYLLTIITNKEILDFWFHLTRWGMFFIPPMLTLLTWKLVDNKSKGFLYSVVVPGFAITISLCIANMFFFRSELQESEGGFLPKPDIIYYIFATLFIYSLAGAIAFCSIRFKKASLRQKKRTLWLLITMLATLSVGIISIYLMMYDFYLSKFIGSTSNIIFISLLFYSSVEHNLMDITLALKEGISRAILLAMFIWFYFIVVSALGEYARTIEGLLVTVIFIGIILESYPRMLKWLLNKTKKFLSNDGYDIDELLLETEKLLNDCINIKMLLSVCDDIFGRVLKLDGYHLQVLSEDGTNKMMLRDVVFYARPFEDVIMTDEIPSDILSKIAKFNPEAFILATGAGKDLALLFIGKPLYSSHLTYSQIKFFQWFRAKLGEVLLRIERVKTMEGELTQAKKKLSVLSVINQYHHDIKAPLAIIDGIITADVYDKKKQKEVVLEQVDRASKLITTMADILHGERKREVAVVNMEEVIKDSVGLFAHSIDSVMYHFDDIPHISGEKEDLKILVLNVIKNSIEAKREGYAIRLTISAWTDQHGLFIKFEDNGVGIPKEQLDKIWTEYTTTKVSGSGIGLQAVKRIADEHGATINVVSSVDTGTAFTFTFPASILVRSKRKPGKIIDGGWPKSS